MIELRWYVEEWDEYRDGLRIGISHKEPPVLQARYMVNIEELGIQEPIWSEWHDVPTVYSDEEGE